MRLVSVIVRVNRTCKLNWMIWNKSFNCLVFCPSVWFYELYSFMCSNYGEQFHGICVIRPISISIDVKVLFGHHPWNINGLIVRCADKMCSGYYSVAATIVIIALSFLLAIATVALDSSGTRHRIILIFIDWSKGRHSHLSQTNITTHLI